MTPAPWVNVIANPDFGTLVSESGSATTWSENAHEFRLTPWSNDPVGDANTEAFYIRDETSGRFWSPTLLPTRGAGEYIARHGFGYSVFEHREAEIESELRIHVAIDAPVKFSMLTLRNRSQQSRRLSVTGYLDWVLGDERAKTLTQVVTHLDARTGALYARNAYNTDFAERTAFFAVDAPDDDAHSRPAATAATFSASAARWPHPPRSRGSTYPAASAPRSIPVRRCAARSIWRQARNASSSSGWVPARPRPRREIGSAPRADSRPHRQRSTPCAPTGNTRSARSRCRPPTRP